VLVCHRTYKLTELRHAHVTERLKRDAMESIGIATGAAMDAINNGAATVWHNQQQLEAEARVLHDQSKRLTKQSEQWVASYKGFHQALKALGDVENWAKAIESDMSFISSSLEGIQQQREAQHSSHLSSGESGER
jgi:cytochrome c556